ncbi:endo-1,4-beta-xylanase [Sorangium sp. So ce1389]|uniref:endo-1,4-beta-xylanase n=1 Tax=Sorangium sp. So ce1389 TaxID=3133336 RepID=UPI003F61536F
MCSSSGGGILSEARLSIVPPGGDAAPAPDAPSAHLRICSRTAPMRSRRRAPRFCRSRVLLEDQIPRELRKEGEDGPSAESNLCADIRRFAELGLKVNISELDARTLLLPGTRDSRWQAQRLACQQIAGACVVEPGCEAVTFWGFTDIRFRGHPGRRARRRSAARARTAGATRCVRAHPGERPGGAEVVLRAYLSGRRLRDRHVSAAAPTCAPATGGASSARATRGPGRQRAVCSALRAL